MNPRQTHNVHHIIETPTGIVRRTALLPLPRSRWEVVNKEVQDMSCLGVTDPPNSNWQSPTVLVPKLDSSVWFCIDFREVNILATVDTYPEPHADVLISQLGEGRFMSALDLTKGYWPVPLRAQDRTKPTFATLKGLFQFTAMPLWLHGAAATFQCLIDTALGTGEGYTLAYLDDIIIYSKTWKEHIAHLRQVFHYLQEAGLKINPKKSIHRCIWAIW